jgi:DNA invertase Pin-like site-specific DNA recombinase
VGIWESYALVAADHDEWSVGAIYMRESKREQVEGFSPAAQLKGTLEAATSRRLWIPIEHVFLDAVSGRREDRAAFQDLLALARGGKIVTVLVLHTSRWARNAMISRRYKDELRARGVDVVALNAPFDIAKPEGKFAERLMEAVDEFTSDTIGFWVA